MQLLRDLQGWGPDSHSSRQLAGRVQELCPPWSRMSDTKQCVTRELTCTWKIADSGWGDNTEGYLLRSSQALRGDPHRCGWRSCTSNFRKIFHSQWGQSRSEWLVSDRVWGDYSSTVQRSQQEPPILVGFLGPSHLLPLKDLVGTLAETNGIVTSCFQSTVPEDINYCFTQESVSWICLSHLVEVMVSEATPVSNVVLTCEISYQYLFVVMSLCLMLLAILPKWVSTLPSVVFFSWVWSELVWWLS